MKQDFAPTARIKRVGPKGPATKRQKRARAARAEEQRLLEIEQRERRLGRA